jgi:TRAP-type C4-dicarboxylate transport system permease small subunit
MRGYLMENSAASPVKTVKPNIFMQIIDKASYWSAVWFERIAMVGIVGIIITTLIDVIGAKLFQKPLSAGTEAVYFLQIIAIASALAFAQVDNRHVRLEFVDSFPKTVRGAFNFLSAFLGLALFIVLTWKSFEYAGNLRNANEVTSASRIPLFPFAVWIGLSCIPMCLVLLKGMVNSIVEVIKR